MRIWLITVGEPLPTDSSGGERLLRTGILADLVARRGDDVVFWTSSFDHARKQHRFAGDTDIQVNPSYQLRLLHAPGYRTNVSLRRIVNHRGVARRFERLAASMPQPDVILCSLPTLELCAAATDYGRKHGVPVVLDIRDLWPDVLAEVAPTPLRPMARFACSLMYAQCRTACSQATAITGVTDEYVEWGVAHAERPRCEFDRHFPMGYIARTPSTADIREAEKFWAKHGIHSETNQFVACWFGMMGRHSEINIVIEAARRLSQRGISVRFVLCGTGPNLERCRRLAAGCPNLLLPGWINAAQIWTLLRISSVGLAPYVSIDNYTRNVPNKPVEYLSAGLPVVSSLQGVLAKLLSDHDCGVTYRNGDAEELAQVLTKLKKSPQLRRMSENAIALYRSQFVAEDVYSEMHDYLRGLAEHAARSGSTATAA